MSSRAAWLLLLWGACGPSLTWGAGAWLLGAVAWAVLRPGPAAHLVLSISASSAVAAALLHGGAQASMAAAATLGALLVLPDHSKSPRTVLPWGVAALTGAVAAAWMLIPQLLPHADAVAPRPLDDVLPVAGVLAVTPCVAAALTRLQMHVAGHAGLALAGAIGLASGAWLAWSPWPSTFEAQVGHVHALRRAGLRDVETRRVEDAMLAAVDAGAFDVAIRWYRDVSRAEDGTRRRPLVSWAMARAVEGAGGPASDVEAHLQESARRMGVDVHPRVDAWPGRERFAEAACRAESRACRVLRPDAQPVNLADTRECFGGTWCLLSAELPVLVKGGPPGVMRTTWRKVAPAVGPVELWALYDWHGWHIHGPLGGMDVPVGGTFTVETPVPMTGADGAEHEVRIWLMPHDGGARLLQRNQPGSHVMVGMAQPAPAAAP